MAFSTRGWRSFNHLFAKIGPATAQAVHYAYTHGLAG
jgi:hypothetical protein